MRNASGTGASERGSSVPTGYGASVTTIPRAVNRVDGDGQLPNSARYVECPPYLGHEGARVPDGLANLVLRKVHV